LAYFLTLKMEVICSFETSFDFQLSTQHYTRLSQQVNYKWI
jgi:hypothetical protein